MTKAAPRPTRDSHLGGPKQGPGSAEIGCDN